MGPGAQAHQPTIHIVAGPTAGGKSAFALTLAQTSNGVIINADSRQIFDGLAVLTAQPTDADKKLVRHELYGALHPNAPCSAGLWRTMAMEKIESVLAANQTPIIVGGTGLYLKALIEGLSPMPDVPAEIRAAAVKLQQEIGTPALHEKLKQRDPDMAARFHPEHTARIVRAWEVLEATGKSLGEWQRMPKTAPPAHWHFEIHKIVPDRKELERRCDLRFAQMLDAGALDEVRDFAALVQNGTINANTPLTNSLGYDALKQHLDGVLTLDAATAQAQLETRQYAKRQLTWFRNQL